MKKLILIILVILFIVGAFFLGILYWMMNPNLSVYEQYRNPMIVERPDETVIAVSVSGDPSSASSDGISKLFQAYYQLEGVSKSQMPAPKARWKGEYSDIDSVLEGEFAMFVPDNVSQVPAGVEKKTWAYGLTAQILYTGPYDQEAETIDRLKQYITDQGYEIIGQHEEEYLKGPLWFIKGNPDNYKTLISYRVEKIETTDEISDTAAAVLMAIKNKNGLADFVHPAKGVRFSPYAYVDLDKNLVLRPEDFDFTNSVKYTWGNYDGRGDAISLTLDEYWDKFVYDKDFISAASVGYNEFFGSGNTANNVLTAYPNALTVEYYYPGSAEYDQMDWASLILSFEKFGNNWSLVGITHNQWTI